MQILSLKEETSSCLMEEGRGVTIAAPPFSGDFLCLDPALFSCFTPRMTPLRFDLCYCYLSGVWSISSISYSFDYFNYYCTFPWVRLCFSPHADMMPLMKKAQRDNKNQCIPSSLKLLEQGMSPSMQENLIHVRSQNTEENNFSVPSTFLCKHVQAIHITASFLSGICCLLTHAVLVGSHVCIEFHFKVFSQELTAQGFLQPESSIQII